MGLLGVAASVVVGGAIAKKAGSALAPDAQTVKRTAEEEEALKQRVQQFNHFRKHGVPAQERFFANQTGQDAQGNIVKGGKLNADGSTRINTHAATMAAEKQLGAAERAQFDPDGPAMDTQEALKMAGQGAQIERDMGQAQQDNLTYGTGNVASVAQGGKATALQGQGEMASLANQDAMMAADQTNQRRQQRAAMSASALGAVTSLGINAMAGGAFGGAGTPEPKAHAPIDAQARRGV